MHAGLAAGTLITYLATLWASARIRSPRKLLLFRTLLGVISGVVGTALILCALRGAPVALAAHL